MCSKQDGSITINNENVQGFFESLQQRRIVLMDNGELAVLSGTTCIGDRVCLLSGADSLCALRLEQDEKWTLASGEVDIFADGFRCEGFHRSWFMCDGYILQNQDRLENFIIK